MSKEYDPNIDSEQEGWNVDKWGRRKPGDKDNCFSSFLILVGIGAAGGLGLVMFAIRALA